jgi:hypothetical protein
MNASVLLLPGVAPVRKISLGQKVLGHAVFVLMGLSSPLSVLGIFCETPYFVRGGAWELENDGNDGSGQHAPVWYRASLSSSYSDSDSSRSNGDQSLTRDGAPEGLQLVSFAMVAFAVGSVASVVYLTCFYVRRLSVSTRRIDVDTPALFVMWIGNTVAMLLVVFLWRLRAFGLSAGLLGAATIAGASLCGSAMVTFSFASQFRRSCKTALAFGYGLSLVLVPGLTLVQHPDAPIFSTAVYFGALLTIVVTAVVLFAVGLRTSLRELRLPAEEEFDVSTAPEPLTQRSLLSRTWKLHLALALVSLLTLFVPATIPFLSADENMWKWLNTSFLVALAAGAAIAAIERVYVTKTMVLIQTGLLFPLLLPFFSSTTQNFLPSWLLVVAMSLFGIFGGLDRFQHRVPRR